MVTLKAHAKINIFLNVAFFGCIIASFFLIYFEYNAYSIGLNSIQHNLTLNATEIMATMKFSNFSLAACGIPSDSERQTICDNIDNFQNAGLVYLAISSVVLCLLWLSILNLVNLILIQSNVFTKLNRQHLLTTVLYILAVCSYLKISNFYYLEPKTSLNERMGKNFLFLTIAIGILTTLHYVYLKMSRKIDRLHSTGLTALNAAMMSPNCNLNLKMGQEGSVFSWWQFHQCWEVGSDCERLNAEISGENLKPEMSETELKRTHHQIVEDLKREVEIKAYELSEITTKLTKANEQIRKMGNAKEELQILKRDVQIAQSNAMNEKEEYSTLRRAMEIKDIEIADLKAALKNRPTKEDERDKELQRISLMLVDLRRQVNEGKDDSEQKDREINRLSQVIKKQKDDTDMLGQSYASRVSPTRSPLPSTDRDQSPNERAYAALQQQAAEAARMKGTIANLQKQAANKINAEGEKDDEIARLTKLLQNKQMENEMIEMHAIELEKAQSKLAKKKASKSALKSQLKEQEATIKTEKFEGERLLREANQNLESKRQEISNLSQMLAKNIAEQPEMQKILVEKDNELTKLNERLNHKISKISAVREELQRFNDEKAAMQKELQERERQQALQKVDSDQKLQDLRKELSASEISNKKLQASIERNTTGSAELKKQLSDKAKELDSLQNKLEKNRTSNFALRTEYAAAQNESQKQANIIIEKEKEEEELRRQLTEKNGEIFKLNSDLNTRSTNDTNVQRMLEEKDSEIHKQMLLNNELSKLHATDLSKLQNTLSDNYSKEMKELEEQHDAELEKQIDELSRMRDMNQKVNFKLGEVVSAAQKVAAERDGLQFENSTLAEKLEAAEGEVASLSQRLEIALNENERLKSLNSQLKKELSEVASQQIESEENTIRKSASKDGEIMVLNLKIAELSEQLSDFEVKYLMLLKEKELLKASIYEQEGQLKKATEECASLHNELFSQATKRTRNFSDDEQLSFRSDHSSQDIIIVEGINSDSLNRANPLLDKVSSLKEEGPMTYSNVWKLFENLQSEKYKLDHLEMSLGRQPKGMTEFMLDFVYMHYGLKSLALRQLKALMVSLEQLYKVGHTYGILFCRYLGLFHPRALPTHVSNFLILAQESFNSVVITVSKQTFVQHYEIAQYGGEAPFIDVMELIVKICNGNREAGERIISHLLTDNMNRLDLILLKICGTMARMGKNPRYIFDLLDVDHSGQLDYHEFVDGIRYTLNIWVTQEEAVELCSYLDHEETGLVSYTEWVSRVNFKEYTSKAKSEAARVTKADFLAALVEEYEYEVIGDYYSLRKMITAKYLSRDKMAELLIQLDPEMEEKEIKQFYEEALAQESSSRNGVSPENFTIVVLKNRIGGYGIGMFDTVQLDKVVPKITTPLSTNESGEISHIDIRKARAMSKK